MKKFVSIMLTTLLLKVLLSESSNKGAGAEAAVTAVPGTSIYQMNDAGLASQAALKGTKFWADENLN